MDSLLHDLLAYVESKNLNEGDFLLACKALKDCFTQIGSSSVRIISKPVNVSVIFLHSKKKKQWGFKINSITEKIFSSSDDIHDFNKYHISYDFICDKGVVRRDENTLDFSLNNRDIMSQCLYPDVAIFETPSIDMAITFSEWKNETSNTSKKDFIEAMLDLCKKLCKREANIQRGGEMQGWW